MIFLTLTQEECDFLRSLLELEGEATPAPPEQEGIVQQLRAALPETPPARGTVFDGLHRQIDFFSLLPQGKEQFSSWLQQQGLDERTATQIASGTLRGGESFGHAHAIDVAHLIEQAFYQQNVRDLSLRIVADGDADTYDGHLNIEVQEVHRWFDP